MTDTTGSNSISAPKSGENTWIWLLKITTGPLLLIILGIHLVVNHFIGQTGLMTYADVIAYYRNPIIPAMEILFLISVVTHSLSGLRGIILDLKPSRNALKMIDWVMVLLGIAAVVYGTWLALTIAMSGA